jgi:hypothetical protein
MTERDDMSTAEVSALLAAEWGLADCEVTALDGGKGLADARRGFGR